MPLSSQLLAQSRNLQPGSAYDPMDDRDLLRSLSEPVIGGLGIVGNLLDLPGSMVRDALTLNNPIDQLLSPTTAENRISGRDMLAEWGFAAPNKETGISGWLDDPMEGVRDVGGFAAEVLFDPLTYMTFGASAGTKAGSALQKAGIWDELPDVAKQVTGKTMGPREARASLKFDDVYNLLSPEQVDAVSYAAKQSGDEISDLMGKPLAGAFGVGKPWGDPMLTFGSAGPIAQKTARAVDKGADWFKKSAVGRYTRGLFDNRVRGEFDLRSQEIAEQMSKRFPGAARAAKQPVAQYNRELKETYQAFEDAFGPEILNRNLDQLEETAINQLSKDAQKRLYNEAREARKPLWGNPSGRPDRGPMGKVWEKADEYFKPEEYVWQMDGQRRALITELRRKSGLNPLTAQNKGWEDHAHIPGFDLVFQDHQRELARIGIKDVEELYEILKTPFGKGPARSDFLDDAIQDVAEELGMDPDEIRRLQQPTMEEFKDAALETAKKEFVEQSGKNPSFADLKVGDAVRPGGTTDDYFSGRVSAISPAGVEVYFRDPITGDRRYQVFMKDDELIRTGEDTAQLAAEQVMDVLDDLITYTGERGDNVDEAFGRFLGGKDVPTGPVDAELRSKIVELARSVKSAEREIADTIQKLGGRLSLMEESENYAHMGRYQHKITKAEHGYGGRKLPTQADLMKSRNPPIRTLPQDVVNELVVDPSAGSSEYVLEAYTNYLDDAYMGGNRGFTVFDEAKTGDAVSIRGEMVDGEIVISPGEDFFGMGDGLEDFAFSRVFTSKTRDDLLRQLNRRIDAGVWGKMRATLEVGETAQFDDMAKAWAKENGYDAIAFKGQKVADADFFEGQFILPVQSKRELHAHDLAKYAEKHHKRIARSKPNEQGFRRDRVFTQRSLDNFLKYMQDGHKVAASYQAIHEVFSRNLVEEGVPLLDAFDKLGMDSVNASQHFASKYGIDNIEQAFVDPEVVEAAGGVAKIMEDPEWLGRVGKFIDGFNRMFKTAVTVPFPGFVLRNAGSGQIVNVTSGYVNGAKDLANYLKHVKTSFGDLKAGRLGKYADEILEYEVFSKREAGFMDLDRGGVVSEAPLFGEPTDILPDSPFTLRENYRSAQSEILGRQALPDSEMGLFDKMSRPAGGMLDPVRKGYRRVREGYGTAVRTGQNANDMAEYVNRVSMYRYLRDKGFSPDMAAQKVKDLHFDYGALSPFEKQVMKRAIPFYSFTRKVVPLVLETLGNRPGGPLGQLIRLSNEGRENRPFEPEHVARTMSIPLGQTEDGGQKYFTNFGLAHEDALRLMDPGVGMDLLSRTNPMIKGPLEAITGMSFFQGGRDLRDLDPAVGRLLANVTGSEDPVKIPASAEQILMNSPFSRAITTARAATDSRYSALEKLLKLGTGLKTTIVEPKTVDAVMRDAVNEAMRNAGGKVFEAHYIGKDKLAKMSPEERQTADKLNALMKALSNRAKDRAKTANELKGGDRRER